MPTFPSLFGPSKNKLNKLLLEAAKDGDKEKARQLLNKGANIEATDEDGRTPLHWACRDGHVEVVKMLLAKGANIEANDYFGLTPLHYAYREDVEITAMLLAKGANIETKDIDGQTPLHKACLRGHVEVSKMLLAKGANTEATDEYGYTPLHLACAKGHVEIVKMLLTKGANIKATNNEGETPLDVAKSNHKESVVEFLTTHRNVNNSQNLQSLKYDDSSQSSMSSLKDEYLGASDDTNRTQEEGSERVEDTGTAPLQPDPAEGKVEIAALHRDSAEGNVDVASKPNNHSGLQSSARVREDPPGLFDDDTELHLDSAENKVDSTKSAAEDTSAESGSDGDSSIVKGNSADSVQSIGEYDEIRSKLNAMIEDQVAMEPLRLPQSYIQEIKTNNRLGGGFFGEVRLGEDSVIGKQFAFKLINPRAIDEAFASRIGPIQKSFQMEIKVLSQLKHPNIAPLYGYCMEGNHLENTCLVYELATNGSLDKFWENDLGRSRLSDDKVRTRIALEVATALRYMHEGLDGGDVCFHRDIKSGNICLAADLSSRVIDCGLSKYVTESDGSVSSAGPSGTPGYLCPLYSQGIIPFCSACDVFSFGVLLCELITGKTNSRQTPHFANYKIKKGVLVNDADECVYWGESSRLESLSKLALECMELDVLSRPSIGDLVEELGDILRHNKQYHKKESNSIVTTQQPLIKCRSCGLDSSSNTIIHCFGSQKHYHCHNCFENHIKKNMNSFRYELTCPKEGCNSRRFLDTEVANMISSNVWALYLNQSKMIGLFQHLERTLTSKVESECRQVKDLQAQLCAGNGLPCPRRFVLVAADRHGKLLHNPHEWAKNLVSIKLYIYFVCSHSQEMVSDDARIKVRCTRDWLEKIAPALNASLTLITLSLKMCVGASLSLDFFKIQELDEWSKELMNQDDKKLLERASQSGDYNQVKALNNKSLSYVAEKIETNRTWLNEMVPVYDSKDKVPTFVLTKYACLPRYSSADSA